MRVVRVGGTMSIQGGWHWRGSYRWTGGAVNIRGGGAIGGGLTGGVAAH